MRLRVRRDRLLDDAYEQLGGAGDQLKARLDVTFVNEQGLQEAGLDYGGLMKDFIEDVGPAASLMIAALQSRQTFQRMG